MPEPLKPIGFWSYTRSDDASAGGRLSRLRQLLANELQLLIGRRQQVHIFQDIETLPPGADWLKEINRALGESSFLLPIVTPAFLENEMCCQEVRRFRQREQELGRDDLIFPFGYIDVSDIEPDEVHDPTVLALLNSRQWFDFASLRYQAPDSEEVATKLGGLAASIRSALRRPVAPQPPKPPPLPDQAVGPHFELDAMGVIHFAPPEALDRHGNNVALLRSLHPPLRDLVRVLAEAFARTDAHGQLAACVRRYREIIDQELDQIDFRLLYAQGLILDNTRLADASDTEQPTLDPSLKATLNSLLQIHGPFVSATIDGLDLLAAEERYQRRPEEERQYRVEAVAFAEKLQNRPAVIDPAVASAVQEATSQISQGTNPERSGVVATNMLRNLVIVSTFGATVAALPVVGTLALGPGGTVAGVFAALLGGEALKKSKPFGMIQQAITTRLDHLSGGELIAEIERIARAWRPQLNFVMSAESALRQLAGNRGLFSWVSESLDWIKRQPTVAGSTPAKPEPPTGRPERPAARTAAAPRVMRERPGPEMVLIPAGRFTMGVPEAESEREGTDDSAARPRHLVTIARPFWLGSYPVTQGEYADFAAETGRGGEAWASIPFAQDERHPVVNVSHADAEAYVVWLSQKTGQMYRLPSEAEWEYAARAGTTTARYWGEDAGKPGEHAHFGSSEGTCRVGAFKPNGFGLHDMLGNVWEWTADHWHADYKGAPSDGSAWTTGGAAGRVVRGGSWLLEAGRVRAAYRFQGAPADRVVNLGFRCARVQV